MQRRTFLIGAGATLASGAAARTPMFGGAGFAEAVAALERETRGRMGVAILDTASGARFAWRGGERFPMCSTFKMVLAGAVLARIDTARERLDRTVAVARGDLVPHAPFAETRVGGTATVAELCAAAVGQSDNAAANLLLATLGGPVGLTRFLRATGDPATRLDRLEPMLNSAMPGDPRDTTTPAAMLATLRRLTLGTVLSADSRARLVAWMVAATTGTKRLRAGLPAQWRVADKTGAGNNGTDNVVALLWPAGRAAPLLVTSYITGSPLPLAQTNAAQAQLGRAIAAAVRG
ncbi:class A beta-lactamase [Sphingomonas sp.]|jgi:beta-lactamase class A|uniref:class A beta-lactamase n=1 Tax=Sphingomonas sp. TaxID=28214 RepID=UPI002ED83CB5